MKRERPYLCILTRNTPAGQPHGQKWRQHPVPWASGGQWGDSARVLSPAGGACGRKRSPKAAAGVGLLGPGYCWAWGEGPREQPWPLWVPCTGVPRPSPAPRSGPHTVGLGTKARWASLGHSLLQPIWTPPPHAGSCTEVRHAHPTPHSTLCLTSYSARFGGHLVLGWAVIEHPQC